ncbi:MAG: carbon-phosphorus lyase complex subunit PhnI [Ferruginibacter sp.]|nr:carbon-phosphorus lyase complex subunit PhnI [Cytophagales bacterium]
MGYVAVKGGTEAIENATDLVEFYRVRDQTSPVQLQQLQAQFRLAIDKIMGEGSFYAPEYGALALKQVEGDGLEAAFILRAFRATLSRKYYSAILDTKSMFVQRRISSSFRDIPGGQVLGPTRDYTQRLIDTRLVDETNEHIRAFLAGFASRIDAATPGEVTTFGKVVDILRAQGLLKEVRPEDRRVVDITREAVKFPAPRSARLQMLARAETGGIMALGYSSMRGHGGVHPTVGELRVGLVDVKVTDPAGRNRYIGRIRVTEAEMITEAQTAGKEAVPYYAIGYGLCFGQNETKAICMGILDRALRTEGNRAPANDQEFVLYHTDGIEAMGFTSHLKLPHYVTFQSGLSNLREAVDRERAAKKDQGQSSTAEPEPPEQPAVVFAENPDLTG